MHDDDMRYTALGRLTAELRRRGWRAERGASATGVPLVYLPDPAGTRRTETVCATHTPEDERPWFYWSFGPANGPTDEIPRAAHAIAQALHDHLVREAA